MKKNGKDNVKGNDKETVRKMVSVPYDVNDPFKAAYLEEGKREYNEILSKHGMKIILVLSTALTVSILTNGVLTYWLRNQPVHYFATNNGSIIEQHATDKPFYTGESVMNFGTGEMIKALSLNFVNFESQLSSVRSSFTTNGYISFRKALSDSGLLQKIRDKRLNIRLTTSPGALVTEGLLPSTSDYAWQFRIPVQIQLVGQAQEYQPEEYDLYVQIQQVDVNQDPKGLRIASTILKPR